LIVLDASAVLELLLNTENGSLVRARIADPDETLHAPHLLSVEVAQVLRRYVASSSVSPERAAAALEDLAALDIARYPHEPLLRRVWELRDNITAYDAVYVALAEILESSVVTFDSRLAGSPGHAAAVELLGG
jgi:predicted nucleic acid-binding protein